IATAAAISSDGVFVTAGGDDITAATAIDSNGVFGAGDNDNDDDGIAATSDVYFQCLKHFETVPHYVSKCFTLSPNIP
ncbi:10885_t:CDS:1, partial [Funneliformis geosporum]